MHIVDDQAKDKVAQYFNEALKAIGRRDEEQAQVTDILNVLKEQHDIQPKIARKILAAMKKGNLPEVKEENEEFEDLYDIVYK